MWKLHRKLNFPNIFRLAAIYTPAPAFNFKLALKHLQYVASIIIQTFKNLFEYANCSDMYVVHISAIYQNSVSSKTLDI